MSVSPVNQFHSLALFTVICMGLMALIDLRRKRKACLPYPLSSDSYRAFMAIVANIPATVIPIFSENDMIINITAGLGGIALVMYLRGQPQRFSLWSTPSRRLLTCAAGSVLVALGMLFYASTWFMPPLFAMIAFWLQERANQLALIDLLKEIDGLSSKIYSTQAALHNHAKYPEHKSEGDFLRKTG